MSISCCLTKLGLSTQNPGYVTICNQSTEYFKDNNGNLLRLSSHSLEDAWNSETRKEIDIALHSGIKHKNCQHCWDEEAAGKISKRQRHNEELNGILPLDNQPRALLLKPGNKCNLACRHCQPEVSSGWYKESYHLNKVTDSFYYYVKKFNETKISYDEKASIWKIINNWMPNLVYFDLYGAEPLLIEDLYSSLKYSSENNYSINQSIHINTNGTIWKDDFLNVFSKFKSVYIDISADGVYEQFEYMRYPAKWSNFINNLEKYKNLSDKYPNIQIGITVTVSIYNVYYLPETVQYFENMGFNCGVNIVHTPDYLNMRIAPQKLKNEIIKKLTNYKELHTIINYLKIPFNNSEDLYKEFVEHHKDLDNLRQQKYNEIFSPLDFINDRFI